MVRCSNPNLLRCYANKTLAALMPNIVNPPPVRLEHPNTFVANVSKF